MNLLKVLARANLIVLPLTILFMMLWRDLAPSGELVIAQNLSAYSPSVSAIYPLGRVDEIMALDGGEFYQPIIHEPVYFDVLLPRRLRAARLRLIYRSENLDDLKIGLKINGSGWQYDLKSAAVAGQTDAQGWRTDEYIFSLDRAAIEKRRVRFIVSAPSLGHENALLYLKRAEIQFSGRPLTFSDVFYAVLDKLMKLVYA